MSLHLGINVFHDVGFAVVNSNGEPVAIYEETKFTGRKEEYLYPFQSLEQLKRDGFEEFDSITWPIECTNLLDLPEEYNFHKLGVSSTKDFENYLNKIFKIKNKHTLYHHAVHAESVFYASGYENAHILVIDGAGEEQSISVFFGDINSKEGIKEFLRVPRSQFSYGHLYGFVTSYLGYSKGNSNTHCGKIMGLSSYGKPIYAEEFRALFNKNNQLFPEAHFSSLEFLSERFGPGYSLANGFSQQQADIAASLQVYLEEDLIRALRDLRKFHPEIPYSNKLCLAGGVAMNSVANGKILFSGLYSDIFVQPASTDAGIAYGAAHFGARKAGSIKTKGSKWIKANYGYDCKASPKDIDSLINEYNLPLTSEKLINAADYIADSLHRSKIIAVCRSKQEVGDRALGFRSIFALPSEEMRDRVNSRIKYREGWRPFAPIILDTYMDKIFETNRPEPFMTVVYPVRPKSPDEIAGIIHVDSTARLQTVNKFSDPFISQVLNQLQIKYSRSPVILNTSFNINGQSMIRTEYDALVTYMATGIDELIINDTLVKRTNAAPEPKPSGITAMDRILQPYLSKQSELTLISIGIEDGIENLLASFLESTCIKNKYKGDLHKINIFSNFSSDKQKWHQEATISKHLGKRMHVNHTIKDSLKMNESISSSHKNILITNGQVLPLKSGYLMSSFKGPTVESELELKDYISRINPTDLIIDIQRRPFTKEDITCLTL